jgi:hypothetical protein
MKKTSKPRHKKFPLPVADIRDDQTLAALSFAWNNSTDAQRHKWERESPKDYINSQPDKHHN